MFKTHTVAQNPASLRRPLQVTEQLPGGPTHCSREGTLVSRGVAFHLLKHQNMIKPMLNLALKMMTRAMAEPFTFW